jgi:hypothetical protein
MNQPSNELHPTLQQVQPSLTWIEQALKDSAATMAPAASDAFAARAQASLRQVSITLVTLVQQLEAAQSALPAEPTPAGEVVPHIGAAPTKRQRKTKPNGHAAPVRVEGTASPVMPVL